MSDPTYDQLVAGARNYALSILAEAKASRAEIEDFDVTAFVLELVNGYRQMNHDDLATFTAVFAEILTRPDDGLDNLEW